MKSQNLLIKFFIIIFGIISHTNSRIPLFSFSDVCFNQTLKCYCDNECHIYGDCCGISPNESLLQEKDFVKCFSLNANTSFDNENQSKVTREFQKLFCDGRPTGVQFYVPVNDEKILLENNLCALCQPENQFDLESLNISLKCSTFHCVLIVNDSRLSGRFCYEQLTSVCPENYELINSSEDCSTELLPLYFRENVSCRNKTDRKVIGRNMSSNGTSCCSCYNDTTYQCVGIPRKIFEKANNNCNSTPISSTSSYKKNSAKESYVKSVSKIDLLIRTNCSVVSTVLLFFCIIIYASIDKLFDDLGKNIVTISTCSLLHSITHLVIRILKPNSTQCTIAAIALHFFYTSASMQGFLFMITVTVQSQRLKLSKILENVGFSKLKKLIVIGFLIAAVIVIGGVSVDLSLPSNNYTPGYGGETCWLSHYIGATLWFIMPGIFIRIADTILLLFISKIFKEVKETIDDFPESSRVKLEYNFWLCIKFNVISFIMIVLNYIKLNLSESVISSIVKILIRLEGTFISLMFLMTTEVRDVIKASV